VDVVLHGAGNSKSAMPAYYRTLPRDQVSDIVSYLKKAGGN
jgi:mono/diheme cytochrome c family protein